MTSRQTKGWGMINTMKKWLRGENDHLSKAGGNWRIDFMMAFELNLGWRRILKDIWYVEIFLLRKGQGQERRARNHKLCSRNDKCFQIHLGLGEDCFSSNKQPDGHRITEHTWSSCVAASFRLQNHNIGSSPCSSWLYSCPAGISLPFLPQVTAYLRGIESQG